jgi:hypothetical protein
VYVAVRRSYASMRLRAWSAVLPGSVASDVVALFLRNSNASAKAGHAIGTHQLRFSVYHVHAKPAPRPKVLAQLPISWRDILLHLGQRLSLKMVWRDVSAAEAAEQ